MNVATLVGDIVQQTDAVGIGAVQERGPVRTQRSKRVGFRTAIKLDGRRNLSDRCIEERVEVAKVMQCDVQFVSGKADVCLGAR